MFYEFLLLKYLCLFAISALIVIFYSGKNL